jgi:predicted NBD/HSP70 family sugar kinase
MGTKVLIGVDPHKATNAVAVLDKHGELLERAEFSTDRRGLRALERWARRIRFISTKMPLTYARV